MPDRRIYRLFEVQGLYARLTDSLTIFKVVTIKTQLKSTPSINTAVYYFVSHWIFNQTQNKNNQYVKKYFYLILIEKPNNYIVGFPVEH